MSYQLLETDGGNGGPGDERTTYGPVFTSLGKVLRWLESRGYTKLQYGKFYRPLKDGESRLGEIDYAIMEVEFDP